MRSPYPGWKNYETWAFAVWLTNNHWDLFIRAAHVARKVAPSCREVVNGCWRLKDAPLLLLTQEVKRIIAEGNPLHDSEPSAYADLMNASLAEVSYRDIARVFITD